jgi:hypothetical protein
MLASKKALYHTGSIWYLNLTASRRYPLIGSSKRYGSRRVVSMCAWARKKGMNAPAWYHRTRSSGAGSPKKPPTSAIMSANDLRDGGRNVPPQKDIPAMLLESNIAVSPARCSASQHRFEPIRLNFAPHVPKLSPVQMAPNRCEPAKKALESTNGLFGVSSRCMRACAVWLC